MSKVHLGNAETLAMQPKPGVASFWGRHETVLRLVAGAALGVGIAYLVWRLG